RRRTTPRHSLSPRLLHFLDNLAISRLPTGVRADQSAECSLRPAREFTTSQHEETLAVERLDGRGGFVGETVRRRWSGLVRHRRPHSQRLSNPNARGASVTERIGSPDPLLEKKIDNF